MPRPPRLLCIAFLSGLVAACANLKTVYRNHDVNGTQVMVTDGGQRLVTATEVPYGNDPKSTEKRLLVCKEKYPDVFWAMAESGSLTIEIASKGAGSGAFASSQEAGFAGLRTQLRESQARMLDGLCDLYAGGAITRDELEIQLRRYQNHILAALAIEQLTGYARPTAITLGGKGHAGVAADLQEAQKKLDAAEAESVTKDNALTTAKAAEEKERKALDELVKANQQPNDAKKKEIETQTKKAVEAKTALTAAETDAADQAANVKAMMANRDAARHAVYASTESSESAISQPQQHVLSDNAAKHIAGAVEEIVKVAFRQHYMAEQCQRFVFDDKRSIDREDVRAEFCIKYFQAIADYNLGSGDKDPDTVYSKDLSLVLSFRQRQKALDKRAADLNKREEAVKKREMRPLQER